METEGPGDPSAGEGETAETGQRRQPGDSQPGEEVRNASCVGGCLCVCLDAQVHTCMFLREACERDLHTVHCS